MAFNWLFVIAAAIVLVGLVGAVVLALGLRGRLVSRAPHCRRCRFDLSGLSLTRGDDASAPVCPECGRGIAGPDDVRRGLRRRSRGMIITGCLLVLVPLLGGGAAILGQRQTNWNVYKPDWWLMIEAANLQPATAGPQVLELRTRLESGTLSLADTRTLVERALTVQADRSGGWTDEWGDLLNAAAVAGLMSEAQLEAHARHAPNILVSGRARIAQGDPCVIELLLAGGRVGDAPVGRPPLELATNLESIRVGEQTHPVRSGQSRMGIHPGSGFSSTTSRHVLTDVVPGTFDAVTTWTFTVRESGNERVLAEWTEQRPMRLTIEPAGTELIELVEDDSLVAGMRAAVAAPAGVTIQRAQGQDSSTFHASLHLQCRTPPADLAVDIILRERVDPARADRALREWPIGRHAFSANGSTTLATGKETGPIDVDAVDIVLRPSRLAAIESIGIYKPWGREIVIENVPVHRPSEDPPGAP